MAGTHEALLSTKIVKNRRNYSTVDADLSVSGTVMVSRNDVFQVFDGRKCAIHLGEMTRKPEVGMKPHNPHYRQFSEQTRVE
jgi:hypothetical protein